MKTPGTRAKRAGHGASGPDDLTCIRRIEYEYLSHGWWVSLRRRGMRIVKRFSDGVWGGKAQALAAAKDYRNALIREIPPLSKLERLNLKRKDNRSGVSGVQRTAKKNVFYWSASLKLPDGRALRKYFSEKKYGAQRARELAIEERKRMLEQIDGEQSYVPAHGERYEAELKRPPRHPHPRPARLLIRVARRTRLGKPVLYTLVSDGVRAKRKVLSEMAHGERAACQLALYTALSWARDLGGEEAARLFEAAHVRDFARLPEAGVRFVVPLTSPAKAP